MSNHLPGTVDSLVAKAHALVDAVTFDENGAMVAGQWVGGNGGMISRQTIIAAHALRLELSGWGTGQAPTTKGAVERQDDPL